MPDEFDRLLDESLKSYIDGPQRAGLEERVLVRARNTRERRVRWYLPGFAVPALAAALIVALWPAPRPRQVRTEQFVRNDIPKPDPITPAAASVSAAKPRLPRVRQRAPLLRAHGPLTAQEQILLQVAVAQPEQLARLGKPTELITVPVIEIKPLSEGEN